MDIIDKFKIWKFVLRFWTFLILNHSDFEPIWYWTFLILNLANSEPFWFWTFGILNLSNFEPFWFWTCLILNLSDYELFWFLNLSDSEPFWFWTFFILNHSDPVPFWFRTYQILSSRQYRGLFEWADPFMRPSVPCCLQSLGWPTTSPSVPVLNWRWKRSTSVPFPLTAHNDHNPS